MDNRNEQKLVAFDVDDTLVTEKFEPIYENIALLKHFYRLGCRIMVWSGGGMDYAKHHAEKLGLSKFVHYYAGKDSATAKASKPHITFDDQKIELGIINIQV